MADEALELYTRLCDDVPGDLGRWVETHVPRDVHIQTLGAVIDLLKTDAMLAMVDADNHPKADFDRAVEFLAAAMDSGRIPAYRGVSYLGDYLTMAHQRGLVIEHPILDPDAFARRALTCLPRTQLEAVELALRIRSEEARPEAGHEEDREAWFAMRAVTLELSWTAPRIKDPQLAAAVREWLELIEHHTS